MSIEQRVATVEGKLVTLEQSLAENTKLTKEVLDTLRAFRMIGTLAKWGTAVGVFVVGGWHGIQAFWKAVH